MSSNFILQIRKYSGDPANLRYKLLAEKLSQFEAAQNQLQTGDIKNSIKVSSSIIQYKESDIVFSRPKTTTFFLPLEPDIVLLKCWFKFDSWGKVTRDASFNNNHGKILGQTPTAAPGPDRGQGSSIAMNLDGSTEFLEVTDNASLRLVGQAVGFSVCFLIQMQTFALTPTGESRYLAEKTDDAGDLWGVYIDSVGKVHFNIKFGGVDYSKSTTSATLALNTWTWVTCTFNASTHAAAIYFNATSQTLSTDTVADSDYSQTRPDLYVGATAMNDGFYDGWIADFRYYREKVLSSTEASNLATNMLSISSIALGSVAMVGASMFQ